MRLFVLRLVKFILIIFPPLIGLEICYRHIESDYSYKAYYLQKNLTKIDNLILGSSHTYYGINPEYFRESAFNLAHVSQSLDLDIYLLEKFKKNTNCRNVIIPISYFSFNSSLLDSKESWRMTDYHYSYEFEDVKTFDKFFLLTHKIGFFRTLLKAVKDSNSPRRYVDGNGFRAAQYESSNISIKGAEQAIKRHTMPTEVLLSDYANNKQLKSLEECVSQNQDLQFVFVTLPVHRYYAERRDQKQLTYIKKCIDHITSRFNNVEYVNYDTMVLPDTCFKDPDHLSIHGAKVVTQELDKIIVRPTNISAGGF